jgi:simple sugar transport system ATP-binding protein
VANASACPEWCGISGEPYRATRAEINRHRVFTLPEEPLRNACVGALSVAG